jgi:hypothetical protein
MSLTTTHIFTQGLMPMKRDIHLAPLDKMGEQLNIDK